MKKLIAMFCCFVNIHFANAQAQSGTISPNAFLQLSTNQTTNIIFPFPITGVDIGSKQVLAQKAISADNILQLKAATDSMSPTNITVITQEHGFYSFVVSYSTNPSVINLSISNNESGALSNISSFQQIEQFFKTQKPFIKRGILSQMMRIRVNGIYLFQEKMWFVIDVKNESEIDYTVDRIDFAIKDRTRPKRTATQEKNIVPQYGSALMQIPGLSRKLVVFAFDPFTFSQQKFLKVKFTEKNGERTVSLPIFSRMLLRAKKVSL